MTSPVDKRKPQPSTKRAPIFPRKGHTKSRRGCYNCKKRKIKCQETLPSCTNCERSGLRCQYPDRPVITALQHSPQPVVTLNSTANTFSLTDMRLFHHYLSTAYPHYPLQSENTWLNYITPIGHQCEYLMHALLALSASHLDKLAPSNLSPIAQMHARSALKGLNEALEKPFRSAEEGDSAIAACYALLMQSWYMDDGLPSFLVMSKSCEAVASKVKDSNVGAVFAQKDRWALIEQIKDRLKGSPTFSLDFTDSAKHSIESLAGLCTKPFEIDMMYRLELCFETLGSSPYEAYVQHCQIDEMVANMKPEERTQLLDESDPVCQLLLAHMIALYLIMRPVSCRERRQYTATMYGIRMTSWIDKVDEKLSDVYKPYIAWPLMVSKFNKEGVLEKYTLNDQGAAQWGRRFLDGSTLHGPSLIPVIRTPSTSDTSVMSSPILHGAPTPDSLIGQ